MQPYEGSDNHIKEAYNDIYAGHNESWRLLSARYKADHIIEVCRGYQFKKVLEVGAGDGSILKLLSERGFAGEYHAVEISQSGIDYIRSRNIPNLKSAGIFDGYKIPFEDNSFDLVILSHVLEHVEHERLLLRELKRVSNMQVIEVPRDYKPNVDGRIKHFLAYGHINVYTPSSLRYLLRSEGFDIVKDLTSMIAPEVTKFNTYVNQKKPKSFVKNLKINTEFTVKTMLAGLMGKNTRERLANAYTVLCKRSNEQVHIF